MRKPQTYISTFVFAALCAGCARQLNNPWSDSGAWDRGELTTASAIGYRSQADTEADQLRRNWPEQEGRFQSGSVTHWPIWWEDPFVDKGNDCTNPQNPDAADPRFAINLV